MPAADRLHPAIYKGVEFYVTSSVTTGGRKTVKHQFVGSSAQLIEDLGGIPRSFSVEGVLVDVWEGGTEVLTYQDHRDNFLAVLEQGGPGQLTHPFFGPLDNVVAVEYSLTDNMTELGRGAISITFEISDTSGDVQEVPQSVAKLQRQVEQLQVLTELTITERLSFSARVFYDSFLDGVAKTTEFVDVVQTATEPIEKVASRISSFNRLVDTLSTKTAQLVDDPARLASAISDTITSISNLFTSVDVAFLSIVDIFQYGLSDVPFLFGSFGELERQSNRDILNSTVQAQSLAYAYLLATQRTYLTVDDIDSTKDLLDDQMEYIQNQKVIDDDVLDQLRQIRVDASALLDELRQNSFRVTTFNTSLTSTSLLAYRHYGSSELADELQSLNSLQDATFVEGVVSVFEENN